MNDAETTLEAASPPASDGSTTSWPATEVELSEDVPTPRATAKDDKDVSEEASTAQSESDQLAKDGKDVHTGETAASTTDSLATPASPTWSRSRLPVSDDEDGASKAEPSLPEKKGADGEHKSGPLESKAQDESQAEGEVKLPENIALEARDEADHPKVRHLSSSAGHTS